ncbi:hypothetical protein JCM11641_003256 [Rhodosporidiobolus odoratus]
MSILAAAVPSPTPTPAPAAGAAPAIPDMDPTIGAFLIGTIFSIFLAGVTCVQVVNYYEHFGRSDIKLLVGVVTGLLICDLFHTAICSYTIYFWTVTHYGNLASLVHAPWTFTWDPFLTGVVTSVVQLFYAWRVFVVSKRKWILPICIGALSLLQLAFAVGGTWKIYMLNREFARFDEFRYGVALWLLAAAAADVLITASLIGYLHRAASNVHQRSTSIVRRIMRITVETNGLTCLVAVADAILFVARPKQSWHVIPNLSLVKLYFNGCLVSLNARTALHQTPVVSHYSDSYAQTAAPRYTSNITSSDERKPNSSCDFDVPTGEKSKFAAVLERLKSLTGTGVAKRRSVEGIRVTRVQETVVGIGSRTGSDVEKGSHAPGSHLIPPSLAYTRPLQPCSPPQAEPQLPTRASSSGSSSSARTAPTIPHVYEPNGSSSGGGVGLAVSAGGAIPKEWH